MEKEEPTATKEAEESAEKALAAVTDLIIATLKEPVATRFQEAQRLCEVAQNLKKARARRAEDFADEGQQQNNGQFQIRGALNAVNIVAANNGNNVAYNVANYDPNMMMADPYQGQQGVGVQYVDDVNGRRQRVRPGQPGAIMFDNQGNLVNEQGIVWAGHMDANALMRHMLMAFGPHAQTGAEANRAKVATEEAAELDTLAGLIAGGVTDPEKSVLEKRIKQLLTNMERRSNANRDPEPPGKEEVHVVPPDDQRGHPPGEGGPEANEAPRVRADGGGDPGDGGAPPAGPLDPVGPAQAVV